MFEQQFEEIEKLIEEENYTKAMEKIEDLEKRQLSEEEKFRCKRLKRDIFIYWGKPEEGLKCTRELIEEGRKRKGLLEEFDAIITLLKELREQERSEDSAELIKIADELLENEDFADKEDSEGKKRVATLLLFKIGQCILRGELDQALILTRQCLTLSKEVGDEALISYALSHLATINYQKGELDQALDNYLQVLAILEKLENDSEISMATNAIGVIYHRLGELDKAQEYYQKSLVLSEKLENFILYTYTITNLGGIHHDKGELDQAQEYYQKSLALAEEHDHKVILAYILIYLSDLSAKQNDHQSAKEALERALKISAEIDAFNASNIRVRALYYYIQLISTFNLPENTDKYLEELRTFDERGENKVFNLYYRLAKALTLKASSNAKDRAVARKLFQQVAEEEVQSLRLTIDAMINLSELLSFELESERNVGLHKELKNLSGMLQKATNKFESFALSAESYLVRAKIASDINISKARNLLTKAQRIADEKRLRRLAERISTERFKLLVKGEMPSRIILALAVYRETSLRQLSELLNITKAGLNRHLKLLIEMGIVQESKEEQVRGSILAKYYRLGPMATQIFQSININLLDSHNENSVIALKNMFYSYRIVSRLSQLFTNQIASYMNFLEKQVMSQSKQSLSSVLDKNDEEKWREMVEEHDEIRIDHYFLSDEQYKVFMDLWNDFSQKVQENVVNKFKDESIERTKYISSVMLPIKKLLEFERMKEKKEKEERKREREQKED
ncbi:MAG: tetratricopeptide repeat protein [Candidatus Hodarchaeota archaeon]